MAFLAHRLHAGNIAVSVVDRQNPLSQVRDELHAPGGEVGIGRL
jgi:hypothetical protein